MHEDEFEDLVHYNPPPYAQWPTRGEVKSVLFGKKHRNHQGLSPPATQHRIDNPALYFHRVTYEHVAEENKACHCTFTVIKAPLARTRGNLNAPEETPHTVSDWDIQPREI